MKGSSTIQPERLVHYKNPERGQIRFLVERNDIEDDIIGNSEKWDYCYVEVNGFDRQSIISAIVRDLYSAESIEDLFTSYTRGENIVNYMRYQNYRALAEAVADGAFFKSELTGIMSRQVFEISMPFDTTLTGGDYEALADYALKAKLYTKSDPVNNKAIVYCSYVLPQHLAILETDPRVEIHTHKGLIL